MYLFKVFTNAQTFVLCQRICYQHRDNTYDLFHFFSFFFFLRILTVPRRKPDKSQASPKSFHPRVERDSVLVSAFIKNIKNLRACSTSCPLSKFILREIAGWPGLTDTGNQGKKEREEFAVVFGVPENPPLFGVLRGVAFAGFQCRNGGPHVPTSWNETRKRWEVGGVARSCLVLLSLSLSLSLSRLPLWNQEEFGVCGDGEFAVIKLNPR